jgi:hypothetical protein
MKFPKTEYQAMTNKTFHPYFYQTCPWRLEDRRDNKDFDRKCQADFKRLSISLKSAKILYPVK